MTIEYWPILIPIPISLPFVLCFVLIRAVVILNNNNNNIVFVIIIVVVVKSFMSLLFSSLPFVNCDPGMETDGCE